MLTSLVSKVLLTLTLVSFSTNLYASKPLKLSVDKTQQKNFIKAERLALKSHSAQYQILYNQLHYYPLQPYLDQKRLMHTMRLSDAEEITQFLKKYQVL